MFRINYIKLEDFKRFPLSTKEVFEHTFNNKVTMITGMNGSGKAQPLTSLVKIPSGWKTMGEIEVGDKVISRDGSICNVIAVHPQGKKYIYKLRFIDGRTVRTTADHLWKVYEYRGYNEFTEKVITTAEIEKRILHEPFGGGVYVDLILPEDSKAIDLGIDFYAFGNLLCRKNYMRPNMLEDSFIENKCKESLKSVKIEALMNGFGLLFKCLRNRFIPECFMHGSTEQRIALLNGIMDSSGYVNKYGDIVTNLASHELAKNVVSLVRSLGGIAYLSSKCVYFAEEFYTVTVIMNNEQLIFSLPRRKNILSTEVNDFKLKVTSVEIDSYEEAKCITIDHESSLYVTNDYVVTHNSSLFNELTPLPSDRNDFGKNGYKELHVELDKSSFVLICDFRNKPLFSFCMNGEELNTAGNVSTQRELVEKYFGITFEIHELLVGKNSFTDMSLINRKKLFNAITHLNIDSILSHYNQLKEELRVNESHLKLQMSLLTAEEDKLKNVNRVESIEKEIEELNKHVEALFSMRGSLTTYLSNKSLTEAYSSFQEHSNRLSSFRQKHFLTLTSYTEESLIEKRNELTQKLNLISYRVNEALKFITEAEEKIKAYEITEQVNSLGFIEEKKVLIENNSSLTNSLKYLAETSEVSTMKNEFFRVESSLPEVVHSIEINENRKYSKENYEKLLQEKEKSLSELMTVSTTEIKHTKELNEYEKTQDSVECPSCKYTWSLNDLPAKIEETKKLLNEAITSKLQLQSKLEQINKEMEEFSVYFQWYRQYSSIRQSTLSSLSLFWKEVDSRELIFTQPKAILKVLSDFLIDIRSIELINKNKLRMKEIDETLELFRKNENNNKASILKDLSKYNELISYLYSEKKEAETTLRSLSRIERMYSHLNTLNNAFKASRSVLFDNNISTVVSNLIQVLDDDLYRHRLTVIEKNKELHQQISILEIIQKHKASIEDLKETIKVLNILLAELSPKNGLIAKTVSSFLNIIISNVNNTISSIWNYKMILKPIDIDSEHLNYKFKVEVEDKFTIEDTRLCSSGMKEAINFSFIVVLYRLLKLNNYPLFLDELGSNMDKDHTNNMVTMIQKLSQSDRFSQIFLITHKENFSYLNNVDVIALDS